ncbi:MAG TPA: hypothetical protein VHD32_01675 [Candidatus Didemnitutus sp.]|nr:hypothetical protein [Candidatus Didemnitutus sp.]
MESTTKVQDAWRTAAREIGFEFTGPYSLSEGSERVQYHGLVAGFGSPKGTVFFASSTFDEDFGPARRLAASHGYFFSVISAVGYGSFERAPFIETLKDWGWRSMDLVPPHGFARPIKSEKRKANKSAQPTRSARG